MIADRNYLYCSNITKQIKLDYLNVAKAAQYCEAHFTAVLYADLWAMEQDSLNRAATCANVDLQSIMREVKECCVNYDYL